MKELNFPPGAARPGGSPAALPAHQGHSRDTRRCKNNITWRLLVLQTWGSGGQVGGGHQGRPDQQGVQAEGREAGPGAGPPRRRYNGAKVFDLVLGGYAEASQGVWTLLGHMANFQLRKLGLARGSSSDKELAILRAPTG